MEFYLIWFPMAKGIGGLLLVSLIAFSIYMKRYKTLCAASLLLILMGVYGHVKVTTPNNIEFGKQEYSSLPQKKGNTNPFGLFENKHNRDI